ncbi:MAG: transketolase [bacterium]
MKSALDLAKIANLLRGDVLKMVYTAGAGHVAGPLSSADLFAILFFGDMIKFDPQKPQWEERDRVVLSCGHYCPVLYSALARSGYFEIGELKTFMQLDSRLPGHPERESAPGIEVSSGPLGQGASVAVGMATALKMKYGHLSKKEAPRVYCVISDGEIQEGQVWEAFNFAVKRQLDNLIFILDKNNIQIENYTSQLVSGGDVAGRLEAFGLHVTQVDGNQIDKLKEGLEKSKLVVGSPAVIVMDTVAGKGVSFMENKPMWHDKVPTLQQMKSAFEELGVMYD